MTAKQTSQFLRSHNDITRHLMLLSHYWYIIYNTNIMVVLACSYSYISLLINCSFPPRFLSSKIHACSAHTLCNLAYSTLGHIQIIICVIQALPSQSISLLMLHISQAFKNFPSTAWALNAAISMQNHKQVIPEWQECRIPLSFIHWWSVKIFD
jgi:hypothetical protein